MIFWDHLVPDYPKKRSRDEPKHRRIFSGFCAWLQIPRNWLIVKPWTRLPYHMTNDHQEEWIQVLFQRFFCLTKYYCFVKNMYPFLCWCFRFFFLLSQSCGLIRPFFGWRLWLVVDFYLDKKQTRERISRSTSCPVTQPSKWHPRWLKRTAVGEHASTQLNYS